MSASCYKRFRCGGSTAVLFLLVVVVLAQLATVVDASISLNLKSSVLSRILSKPSEEESRDSDDSIHFNTQQGTTGTSANPQRKRKDDKESNFLRLDLSGRAHCHLMGPSSVMGYDQSTNALSSTSTLTSTSNVTPLMTTRPIIRTTAGTVGGPLSFCSALSVVVGADYDFSKRWYGATRLLTSLGWSKDQSMKRSGSSSSSSSSSMEVATENDIGFTETDTDTDIVSIDSQDEDRQVYDNKYHPSTPPEFASSTAAGVVMKKPGFWSRLIPAGVKVQAEHCLQDDREFAGQVAVDWDHPDEVMHRQGPSIQARIDSMGKTEASIHVPLHQRFQVQWKVSTSNDGIMQVPHPQESKEGPTVGVPAQQGSSTSSGDENAWWMPDVRIDALGRMESKNEAWVPSPFGSGAGRVGLRLFVSRRLNWNAMGFANDGMESQTLLKLEVQAVGGGSSRSRVLQQDTDTTNYLQFLQGQSITTVRLETELERPVSAARLFLLQEHALGGTVP